MKASSDVASDWGSDVCVADCMVMLPWIVIQISESPPSPGEFARDIHPHHLRCYTVHRSGTCSHTRKIRRDVLIRCLFDVVTGYCTKDGLSRLQDQLQTLADSAHERKTDIDREISTLKAQSENLINAIADGIRADELMKARLERLSVSIAALNASRQSLDGLPNLKKIDLGRLAHTIKSAKTEKERLAIIDIVIGRVCVGYNDKDELCLVTVEPDLYAIGTL